MKNQIVLFSLFLLLISGCNNKTDNGTIPVIDVLGASTGTFNNLSDIAKDIEYIPLETTPEFIMGYIYGMIVSPEGNLFVIEMANNRVTGFDPAGQFLYSLNKEGRGPGEYTRISDFDISDDSRYICVYGVKIDIYDINGGKFDHVRTIQFDSPEKPSNLELVPGSNNIVLPFYSSQGTEPYRCMILDFEGDTLGFRPNYYKYEKKSSIVFGFGAENIFYQKNDNIYLYSDLSDTVFLISDKNEFLPHMILDRGGNMMTVQDKAELLITPGKLNEFIGQFVMFRNLFESERYVYGSYGFDSQNYAFIYDKDDQQKYEVDGVQFFKDDLSGGINFEPKYYNNEFVYSWVDAITLKNYVASDEFKNSSPKFPEKKQQLVELTDNLEETDNPVLVAVKLKN
jgi:hypothetical protein